MSDEDDVNLLKQGASDLQRCDFTGLSYPSRQHYGIDFRGSKLKDSDLSESVFSNCDFRSAELVNSNLSGSEFHNCLFSGAVFKVIFNSSKFQGGQFKILATGCDFTNVTFEQVDVKGLRFGDDNKLDGATIDPSTDFNGVAMPRPLSRLPIFSNYEFSRGVLIRKNSVIPEAHSASEFQEKSAYYDRKARRDAIDSTTQLRNTISRLARKLENDLILLTKADGVSKPNVGMIGHNNPPDPIPLLPEEKNETIESLREIDAIVSSGAKTQENLLPLIEKIKSASKNITHWAASKIDLATDEFSKQIGKTLADGKVYLGAWVIFSGGLDKLVALIGTLP